MTKSTRKSQTSKPDKPYDGFPLTTHPTGRCCKKIRGRLYYFGPWSDTQGALERLNREWPCLSEGRTPPPADTGDGCTMRDLCNAFLTSKRNRLDTGELSSHTFAKYYETCELLIRHFERDRVLLQMELEFSAGI